MKLLSWKTACLYSPVAALVLSITPALAGQTILHEGFEGGLGTWRYDVAESAQGDASGPIVVRDVVHHANHAIRVRFREPMGYSGIIQSINVTAYAGKTLTFSGFLRRFGPTATVGLWMLVSDANKVKLSYDNTYETMKFGTNSWNQYNLTVSIPCNATNLSFGAAIFDGEGTVWIDDLNLQHSKTGAICSK